MIRTHLVRSLYEKLLGPENGPEETVEQPYIKYQIGILESCYHSPNQSNNQKDTSSASDDKNSPRQNLTTDVSTSVDNDVQWPDSEIDMAGSFSLGLSFVLKGTSPKVQICTTFGRYEPKKTIPNLNDSAAKGEEFCTISLPEINAEDQSKINSNGNDFVMYFG